MSDFLMRLAERHLGMGDRVEPVRPPVFGRWMVGEPAPAAPSDDAARTTVEERVAMPDRVASRPSAQGPWRQAGSDDPPADASIEPRKGEQVQSRRGPRALARSGEVDDREIGVAQTPDDASPAPAPRRPPGRATADLSSTPTAASRADARRDERIEPTRRGAPPGPRLDGALEPDGRETVATPIKPEARRAVAMTPFVPPVAPALGSTPTGLRLDGLFDLPVFDAPTPRARPAGRLVPRAAAGPRRETPAASREERIVEVTIGRIEIRATVPAAATAAAMPAPPHRPAVSLDAYLRRRAAESGR